MTHIEEIEVCGYVYRAPCCYIHGERVGHQFAAGAAEREAGDRCEECGEPFRVEIVCRRPDASPMFPDLKHREWTGHIYQPETLYVRRGEPEVARG